MFPIAEIKSDTTIGMREGPWLLQNPNTGDAFEKLIFVVFEE